MARSGLVDRGRLGARGDDEDAGLVLRMADEIDVDRRVGGLSGDPGINLVEGEVLGEGAVNAAVSASR